MIKTGISQIGGKFRLRKTLLAHTPLHEFFLSLFSGSCIYEVNKPRCRYECFNDKDADLINYLLVSSGWDREAQDFTINTRDFEYDEKIIAMLEEMKQGVLGLVSQETCNRIVRGDIVARNNVERAYFFYYLNKLSYGGDQVDFTYRGVTLPGATKELAEKTKAHYCGIMRPTDPIRQPQVDAIKANFRDVTMSGFQKKAEEARANFRGITPKASFCGINNTRALGNSANKRDLDKWRQQFNASYKGINPKTTRPYSNNDCGLLTPLDPLCIERLRYVNLTAYDFWHVYDLFYKAFHVRKGLGIECFVYADPPYPGTEKYYGKKFDPEFHQRLIDRMVKTPFHFMLSIGGECEDLYVEPLRDEGWNVQDVYTKYSTDANSQNSVKEYLIMNYEIDEMPLMVHDNQVDILSWT